MFGLPPAQEIEYLSYYAPLNPRLPFVARQRVGELGWDCKYFDEAVLRRDPFYAEFLPRTGVRYFINGTIVSNADEYGALVVHRSARKRHVQPANIALMERLVPHVRRTFDVSQRLKAVGDVRDALERAFDVLADGVALLRQEGAIIYCNEALQAMLRQGDGVRLRKGMMEFSLPEARANLDAAMRAVGELDPGSTDFIVRRPSGAPAYLVSVFALRRMQREAGKRRADFIVFIRDPSRRGIPTDRALHQLFGLTAAEAGVARALQAGLALTKYAHKQGVSLNTVYTHLRHIREKTGCHSTADLVRKLAELRLTLRRD